MAANSTRLERLEAKRNVKDDGVVWLAWHDAEFASCGAETKTLKQLESEGAKMITLRWVEENQDGDK